MADREDQAARADNDHGSNDNRFADAGSDNGSNGGVRHHIHHADVSPAPLKRATVALRRLAILDDGVLHLVLQTQRRLHRWSAGRVVLETGLPHQVPVQAVAAVEDDRLVHRRGDLAEG